MCGLLLINKPAGITSYGAVSRIKKLTGERHVGHTGTLDPMATGVLPVLIGRATKLSDYILCADKCYTAVVRLGVTTDTLDITGNVLSTSAVGVTNSDIDSALGKFTGVIEQTPPMFSAIKKDGVRLYKLAREGRKADIPSRRVEVFSINRESDPDENFEFTVSCRVSKGTYIRSLVRDIGELLGTGATLSALTRTETAGFVIEDCVSLEELSEDNVKDFILPASRALGNVDTVYVTDAQAVRFSNGGNLYINRTSGKEPEDGETVKVNLKDRFLGLAQATGGTLKVKCLVDPVEKE